MMVVVESYVAFHNFFVEHFNSG